MANEGWSTTHYQFKFEEGHTLEELRETPKAYNFVQAEAATYIFTDTLKDIDLGVGLDAAQIHLSKTCYTIKKNKFKFL